MHQDGNATSQKKKEACRLARGIVMPEVGLVSGGEGAPRSTVGSASPSEFGRRIMLQIYLVRFFVCGPLLTLCPLNFDFDGEFQTFAQG